MRCRLLLLVLAVLAGGCSFGQPEDVTTATTATPPRSVYVAVGAAETAQEDLGGFAGSLFRDALPPQTVFVDVAVADSTAADAVTAQLPDALALEPTLATVWFGPLDRAASTDIASFRDALATIVARLRDAGATVLVAVDEHDAYGDASRAVADAAGAVVVDVIGLDRAPEIAAAFAAALPGD